MARNCPSNPSNPWNASTLANGSAILLVSGRFRRSMDASDAPVRDCGRSCADCGLGALRPETALQTPQTLRHLPMASTQVLPYFWILDASDAPWTLQTLQNLALARLWALGSVRDCGRSCADCGLRALARQIFFFLVARNCPSNPSNASNASTHGSAIRLDSGRFRRSMDASDAPKPRTC